MWIDTVTKNYIKRRVGIVRKTNYTFKIPYKHGFFYKDKTELSNDDYRKIDPFTFFLYHFIETLNSSKPDYIYEKEYDKVMNDRGNYNIDQLKKYFSSDSVLMSTKETKIDSDLNILSIRFLYNYPNDEKFYHRGFYRVAPRYLDVHNFSSLNLRHGCLEIYNKNNQIILDKDLEKTFGWNMRLVRNAFAAFWDVFHIIQYAIWLDDKVVVAESKSCGNYKELVRLAGQNIDYYEEYFDRRPLKSRDTINKYIDYFEHKNDITDISLFNVLQVLNSGK